MGSRARIIAGDADDAAMDWATGLLVDLERCWSRFRPDSELSELNASSGRWFPMSPNLAAAVDRAMALHALTGARFDPRILDALESLGYDRTFREIGTDPIAPGGAVHSPAPVDPAPMSTAIERDGTWIRLPEGTRLDLGGIGKGLAADLVAEGLLARGSTSVCVSMGGDIRAAGDAPEGGWLVPVDDPRQPGRVLGRVVLAGRAIVTSTTAFRRWERDGRAFHHLVDPATGDSSRSGVLAAVVVDAVAWRAEGLAKAAIIAGPADGVALVEGAGAAGWLVLDDGSILDTDGVPPLGDTPVADEVTPG